MKDHDVDEIKKKNSDVYWYHCIDLGNGFVTDGDYDMEQHIKHYNFPDLRGKKVLDVGAASGFFSFFFEKEGAEVMATELPSILEWDWLGGPDAVKRMEGCIKELDKNLKTAFDLARNLLNSKVEKIEINIYDISPEKVGMHDIVFMGSLLNHLREPILALEKLFNVTREMLIVAAPICKLVPGKPVSLFIGHESYDKRSWWLPNQECLIQMIKSVGFRNVLEVSTFTINNRRIKNLNVLHSVIHAYK